MKTIAAAPQFWYLLEDDGNLIFTVSCEHSFVGYDFTMKLSSHEVSAYRSQGPAYLNELAEAINYSCPIALSSASPYKERNVDSQYSELIGKAVESWKRVHGN